MIKANLLSGVQNDRRVHGYFFFFCLAQVLTGILVSAFKEKICIYFIYNLHIWTYVGMNISVLFGTY